ncbi:MFS transporter [Actinoplanes ianthinogenes]|uniref:MFS transporter n=1 Tax=Actinoplanes ianthinogenes TaxID=122358 RepID=A0ABN6C7A9_9ACTN|nr:MFS transporter [Actinoplanes ianthinogenes]BCJ40466.1 MFS transporter [Actinoplanes ianthinogenes]GGR50694.1 MFS transporter [Actinoplanes ianthinogenes]
MWINRRLFALSLGYFLVMLDTTIVTVALPTIGDRLGGDRGTLQWVADAYPVTFAACLLTAGVLSDRLGGRRVFVSGLWAFAALSGASALATGPGVLIGLRALLGIAGALLVPSSLALIAAAYPDPASRARALGVWAALSGSGLVAGPVAGGLLVEAFGWQSVFLAAVPVALAAIALLGRPDRPARPGTGGRRVDAVGQVTSGSALGLLTYGTIARNPTALLLSAAAIVVFVLRQQRAADPMLPSRMFADRTVGAGLAAGTVVNFGLSGVLFVLTLFFQRAHGWSPALTGLAFLPLTVPTAINPILTGRLVARSGPRRPAAAGFLLMAVGAAAQLTDRVPVAMAGLFVLGCGVSLAIPALMAAVVGALPPDLAGVGSGALNAARQIGAVLGVAVLGALPTPTALVVTAAVLLTGAALTATFSGESAPSQPRHPNPSRHRS